jgi:hypothetical protein
MSFIELMLDDVQIYIDICTDHPSTLSSLYIYFIIVFLYLIFISIVALDEDMYNLS